MGLFWYSKSPIISRVELPTTEIIEPNFIKCFSGDDSLSQAGCPYDNAVAESTYRSFKLEFINQETFQSLEELSLKTKDYVHWWNHHRIHSSLNYQTPITKRMIA